MQNNLKWVTMISLSFFMVACSRSLTNNQSNRVLPDKSLIIFVDALNKKDGYTVYQLLAPKDRKTAEDNIKTYLSTIIELNPEEKEAGKIVKLFGQEFFKKFLSSKYYVLEKKIEPVTAELKMLNNNTIADIKLIINGNTSSIKLIKQDRIWYISADNLLT